VKKIAFLFIVSLSLTSCQYLGVDDEWKATVLGAYKGVFTFGNQKAYIVTTLDETGGVIKGNYEYKINSAHFKGELYECSAVRGRNIKCRWKQGTSSGVVTLHFNSTGTEFGGLWGYKEVKKTNIWNGIKFRNRAPKKQELTQVWI